MPNKSISQSDKLGYLIGVALGLLGGVCYGLYLNLSYVRFTSAPWPFYVSMVMGGVIGLVAAMYTRKWWSKSLASLLQWLSSRFTRFSLKSLLILCTVLSLLLGVLGWHFSAYRQQRKAVASLRGQGVRVEYHWPYYNGRPTFLARLSRKVGPDHFLKPYEVRSDEEKLTDASMHALASLYHLETMSFNDTSITTNVLSLPGSREHLKHFSLQRDKNISSDDGAGLKYLSECQHLEWIDLRFVTIPDTGLVFLSRCPKLRTLQLMHVKASDKDLVAISKLVNLRYLTLTDTKITDKGMEALVSLQGLVHLQLGHTAISDHGLKVVGRLSNLKSLGLSFTEITDDGLGYLCNLPKLKDLDLTSSYITDAGLDRLKKLKTLENVSLFQTSISDKGVDDFQKALPNCNIAR